MSLRRSLLPTSLALVLATLTACNTAPIAQTAAPRYAPVIAEPAVEHALKSWGTMPLARVVAPPAALAEKGFSVSETLARILQAEQKNMAKWPATQAIFWKNGAPLKQGDLLVQKDLANSLRLIGRQGARVFYGGEIAHRIAAEMAPHPNAITLQDLRDYKVMERTPVRGTYCGYEIVTMPPPSSVGTHLVQILNMLEGSPLEQWGANSAQTLHQMAEANKLAYADWATRTS